MADYEAVPVDAEEGPRAWCHVMYALHAISAIGGVLTSASIVGSFLLGWPSLLAVVINFATRSRVRGSWLDSHWRWQLRTFWFAAGWALLALLLYVSLIGIPLAIAIMAGTGLWVLYRVVRGWLVLLDRKTVPI